LSISALTTPNSEAVRQHRFRAVAVWLFGCCALIFLMVVVGGITRLTLSGLSITEWKPVTGIIPPLSTADWAVEFAKYKQIPEYQAIHSGITLAEFKGIFYWEYAHRLLGRLIGVAFAVPFLWFLARRQLPRRLTAPLAIILLLGFAQGGLGWYMIKSGLADRIEVSQYRLVAHLALALAIYAAILWTALGIISMRPSPPFRGEREGPAAKGWEGEVGKATATQRRPPPHPALFPRPARGEGAEIGSAWRRAAEALLALVALTILAGGFVAGTRAGLTYNTFPLMDGRLVPAGYGQLQPFYLNWFENIAAVQFDHRALALTVAASVPVMWVAGLRVRLPSPARTALHLLLSAAALQVALGIGTLLLAVPIPLAAAHQAGAVLLLTTAIYFRHSLRIAEPMDAGVAAPI
jgi:cytochrome c oxidase assembly protein subunit 15